MPLFSPFLRYCLTHQKAYAGAICYSKPVKDDEQIQSVHPGATVKEPGTVGKDTEMNPRVKDRLLKS